MDTNILGFHYFIDKVMIIKAAKPALLSSSDAYPFYVFWFLRSNSLIYNNNKKIQKIYNITWCVEKLF